MKKIYIISSFALFLCLMSIPFINSMISIEKEDINIIWGYKQSMLLENYTDIWIQPVLYPNGTSIKGHWESRLANLYQEEIPYIKGIKIEGKEYYDNFNYKLNKDATIWAFPIGDRNMAEYGRCRDYEIRKGVCIQK